MELSDYRAQIDRIDAELLRLFAERMQTAAGIASYKKAHGLPVLDAGREREKLAQIVKTAPEELQEEAVSLYRLLFSLSRSYQDRCTAPDVSLSQQAHRAAKCGLLGEKLPGLDCVSFGPDLTDIHTPRERMHIASVQRTWKLLREVLRRSK